MADRWGKCSALPQLGAYCSPRRFLDITTLPEAGGDELWSPLQPSNRQAQLLPQFGHRLAAAVLELDPLELIPGALVGIQLWGIPRQSLQMQPCRCPTSQVLLDRFPVVDRRPIPDHQQLAPDLTLQLTQKPHDGRSTKRLVLDVGEQPPVGCYRADDGEMVMRQRGPRDGRLPTGRICTSDAGQRI